MTFWQQCAAVFAAMVVLDIVFALYVVTTAAKDALSASWWAAMIQMCNVFVVSSFVKDRRLTLPCVAGAFIGTYIAIQYF